MLAVRLDPDLEARLTAVAKRTGRSKSYYARKAIEGGLDSLRRVEARRPLRKDEEEQRKIGQESLQETRSISSTGSDSRASSLSE